MFENGKLLKKKQQLYADNTERINGRDLEFAKTPAPGDYNNDSVSGATKAVRNVIRLSKKSTPTNASQIEELLKVGPGSYNTECTVTKPRIKGVTQWKNVLEFPPLKDALPKMDTEYEEEPAENGRYNNSVMPRLSPFASKVPRFHGASDSDESSDDGVEVRCFTDSYRIILDLDNT